MSDGVRAGAAPTGSAAVDEAIATVRAHLPLVAVLAALGLAIGIVSAIGSFEGDSVRLNLGLFPLSENQTVISLGVSAPVGPIGADYVADAVMNRVAKDIGARDGASVRRKIDLASISNDPHQVVLISPKIGDASPREVLGSWVSAIQASRRRFVAGQLDRAKAGLLRSLQKAKGTVKKDVLANVARLAALRGSLRSDVTVTRRPYELAGVSDSTTKSTLKAALVGLLGGLVAGIALALARGVMQGRVRTRRALTARTGLPVVGDLRAGQSEIVAECLATISRRGPPFVIDAVGEDRADGAAALAAKTPEGSGGKSGALGEPGTRSALVDSGGWVIAARLGITTVDQLDRILAESATLEAPGMGIVLV